MATLILVINLVGSMFAAVKPVLMLFDRFRQRQNELERMCYKIGYRYYDVVEIVSHMLFESKRVSEVDLSPLQQVNTLLRKFNYVLNSIQNVGSSSDIDILDIRKSFGDFAGEIILKMDDLFTELDKEGKEVDKWRLVCSKNVIALSQAIISQWNLLVSIMARKRLMRTRTLERDFNEKAAGL